MNPEAEKLKTMLRRCLLWFEIEAAEAAISCGEPVDSTPLSEYTTDCGRGPNTIRLDDIREAVK